jgi:hypothetical protein
MNRPLAYRPLSTLAVTGFAIGIVSPVAFLSALLAPVGIMAFLVSLMAFRKLKRERNSLAGINFAVAGLLVSGATVASAVTLHIFDSISIRREVLSHTDRYIDMLLSNRIREAFVATVDPISSAGQSLDQAVWANRQDYQFFRSQPDVSLLKGQAPRAQVVAKWVDSVEYRLNVPFAVVKYTVYLGGTVHEVALTVRNNPSTLQGAHNWFIVDSTVSAPKQDFATSS